MKLFYIDLEQAESRVVGAIVYQLFGESNYLDACESSDLHTLVCSMCWTNLAWPQDFSLEAVQRYGSIPEDIASAAKSVAKKIGYRDMSYRDLSKRLGHGSNYYGQPPAMAKHTHVKQSIIEEFQDAYFSAFPGIREWHLWVAEQLQTLKMITTLLGRRRFFFGRPTDDATLREAIAFEPQSVATGDYMNFGLYKVWRQNYPVHLFGQVHDAIAGAYDERDEHWLIPQICQDLQTKLILKANETKLASLRKHTKLTRNEQHELKTLLELPSREFFIPAEALVGWNLAYRKKLKDGSIINPDGLIVYEGADARERIASPKTSILDYRLS